MADPTGADVEVPEESHQRVLRITLLGYLAAVLLITQWPDPPDPGTLSWLQRVLAQLHDSGLPGAVDLPVVEALANVAMFVPLGLLLPAATRTRAWLAVPAGAGFAALIELSQLIFLPHRVASVQDVVMNTLGAALGAAVLLAIRAWRAADHPPERSSRAATWSRQSHGPSRPPGDITG